MIAFVFVFLVVRLGEVFNFVKMRSYLNEPLRLNINNVPHIFLAREDQLMINYAEWQILDEHRARMDLNTKVVLYCFVDLLSMKPSAIRKIPRCNALTNVCVLIIGVNAEIFILDCYLNSSHQGCQLLFDVSRSSHRSDLNEIVRAPLTAVFVLGPCVVHV